MIKVHTGDQLCFNFGEAAEIMLHNRKKQDEFLADKTCKQKD